MISDLSNVTTFDAVLLNEICCQNASALDLALLWCKGVHLIDDIVDGDVTDKQEIIRSYILLQEFYTHPFFLAYGHQLKEVARLVTVAYAESVAWEKSSVEWQARCADVIRHAGNEMLLAIGDICAGGGMGGYEHRRRISPVLRRLSYFDHHDKEGKPC